MKTANTNRNIKRYGISAIVAGAIFFGGAQAGSAEENKDFGEKLLYNGKSHDHVVELKELLEGKDLLEKPEGADEWDNTYDEATAQAVTEFQEKNALLVDGLTGIQTAGALSELEKGDENELVLYLQEDLAELGYYDFDLDGIFGPITEEGLIQFQQDHDIEADGVAGADTYSVLFDVTSRYNPGTEVAAEASSNSSETGQENSGQSGDASEASSDSSAESANESTNESTESSTEASEDSSSESDSSASEGETTMVMEATAYTAYCDGCSGVTYTGQDLRANPDKKVVAVDPNVIPLGSIVEVEGYGRAVAGDIGGAIQGNRIDLHMATKDEALAFGRQDVKVTVIETP